MASPMTATRRDGRRAADRQVMRSRAHRTVKVGAWSVAVLGVLLFGASIAVPFVMQMFGLRALTVTSGSMEPVFTPGALVILKEIQSADEVKVGQVVTFWPVDEDHLVTHRIVDLKMLPVLREGPGGEMVPMTNASGQPEMRPYIMTKGDANLFPDANATPLTQVRGIIVDSHDRWGSILLWAQSAGGKAALLCPALMMLIISFSRDWATEFLAWRRLRQAERASGQTPVDNWRKSAFGSDA